MSDGLFMRFMRGAFRRPAFTIAACVAQGGHHRAESQHDHSPPQVDVDPKDGGPDGGALIQEDGSVDEKEEPDRPSQVDAHYQNTTLRLTMMSRMITAS